MRSIHEKTIQQKGIVVLLFLFFFLLVYVLILGLVVSIGLASIFVGFLVLQEPNGIAPLVFGGGLIIFGGFLIWFLFLATFRKLKAEAPIMFKATEKRNGQLIQLVNEVADQVGAKRPKNIFITPYVEAGASFNSPILSIFFPGSKNLTLGIGLMNATTEHELRAVLAHEFGHFGQKSMRIGSMVHHINMLVFKTLDNNSKLDNASQEFSQFAGGKSILYLALRGFSKGINWIFSMMWLLINKQNFALMQAMEFHADAVAAGYAGPSALISSLERMPLANESLHSVLRFYSDRLGDNLKSNNVFAEQKWWMGAIAQSAGIRFTDGLPNMETYPLYDFNNRLIVIDQWSSHPTTKDRVEALRQLGLPDPEMNQQHALNILDSPELTCQKLTEQLFSEAPFTFTPTLFNLEEFIEEYNNQESLKAFPEIFSLYYQWVNVSPFSLKSSLLEQIPTDWKPLFDMEIVRMVIDLNFLKTEVEILEIIADPKTYYKSFDYDGKRFQKKNATKLKEALADKIVQFNATIDRNNQAIYSFFHAIAAKIGKSKSVENAYQNLFSAENNWAEKRITRDKILNALNYLVNAQSHLEASDRNQNMEKWDKTLKDILRWVLSKPGILNWLWKTQIARMKEFVNHREAYFADDQINGKLVNHAVEMLQLFDAFALANHHELLQHLANVQYDILIQTGLLEQE